MKNDIYPNQSAQSMARERKINMASTREINIEKLISASWYLAGKFVRRPVSSAAAVSILRHCRESFCLDKEWTFKTNNHEVFKAHNSPFVDHNSRAIIVIRAQLIANVIITNRALNHAEVNKRCSCWVSATDIHSVDVCVSETCSETLGWVTGTNFQTWKTQKIQNSQDDFP